MAGKAKARSASRRFAPAGVAFALGGLALFAYFVWRAEPARVWEKLTEVGAGFAVILLISGLRFAVRALAWTLCFEAPHRLGYAHAFRAFLIGDMAGNVLPVGLVVSEPTKVAAASDRVPLAAAASAIAVENLFYMLSVAAFIFTGAAALLLSFPLPKQLRYSSAGVVVGVCVFAACAFYTARRQARFLSGALEWVAARGVGRRALGSRHEKVRALEDRVYGFYARNRRRFAPILALEFSFHLLGVAEAYATLWLMGGRPPTLFAAFLFESVNRVITMVFKFVPLRAGVDEAGTGALGRVLGFGVEAGVALAIVRKARMLFWMSAGVALLVGRGLSLRAVTGEQSGVWSPESGVEDETAADGSGLPASDSGLRTPDSGLS
ncbi:MAG TPA: lysylphosphatidylglycerol synthase domain-containing protein [Pyrinomonadaceae bacterium]|nr:lysylphosphatidylglycerol synthase domain-containing protein [Pyrinomonadaceae bacterium]